MDYIKSAFVLGSTSPIATSICIELAKRGCKRFHLVSRNYNRNKDLVLVLEKNYGAKVSQEHHDLLSNTSLDNSAISQIEQFDLYLITAGSLGEAYLARDDTSEALSITVANYTGLIPWLTAITSEERICKPGKLWIFSSVAADRGRPSNYHYGAAKAGLTTFCEGLLLRCHNKPFSIRIIKAGFMATSMAVNAPRFLCISPNQVAFRLLRNPSRRGIEYLPWWWKLIMSLVKRLPNQFAAKL